MAGVGLSIGFDEVELVVDAWKTVASVKAPANQMVKLNSIALHADGIAGDAKPLLLRLARVVAGSGSASAATPQKLNNALTVTPQTTARKNFTTEPTADGTDPYIRPGLFHPQGGIIRDDTFSGLYLKEGSELAVQVKVPSGGVAVKVTGGAEVEE